MGAESVQALPDPGSFLGAHRSSKMWDGRKEREWEKRTPLVSFILLKHQFKYIHMYITDSKPSFSEQPPLLLRLNYEREGREINKRTLPPSSGQ